LSFSKGVIHEILSTNLIYRKKELYWMVYLSFWFDSRESTSFDWRNTA